MAKGKTTAYFCQECGHEASKWMGQCPACKAWNSMVEEPTIKIKSETVKGRRNTYKAVRNLYWGRGANPYRAFRTGQSIRRGNCTSFFNFSGWGPRDWQIDSFIADMQDFI